MSLVKVAIWTKHPGDILGEAIDFVTKGIAQHAGFLRGNGTIHELYIPRVRDRAIVDAERPYLKFFDIDGLTPELSQKLETLFDAAIKTHIGYSVLDLFRILFDKPKPDDNSMVCSQYVFHQLSILKLPPLIRCNEDFISPRDLFISPKLID